MDVRLSAYEGPLDLLLRLIARNEMDIFDIPIAELTEQYLQALAGLPADMDNLSEFLVMAATLLEIKSQMLLPRPKPLEDMEEEDPREALVQKLLAYQMAQAVAEQLHGLTPPGNRLTNLGEPELAKEPEQAPLLDGVSMDALWEIFAEIMQRRVARTDTVRAGYGEMPRERFTVPEKVALIKHLLTQGRVRFSKLIAQCRSRREMIVTFLAVLEMIRRGMMLAYQEKDFADIYCEATQTT
ncbi:MAG: segregation/condensation protein A [Defluviitaleaceae bacterium]|nr:segregation/condensation protein A [Defluviitaleaceae bacterium]MCL2274385.1 segregation/condensation protein A [Defluviitaleaceae bacterium]